jgi:hypothetical protein
MDFLIFLETMGIAIFGCIVVGVVLAAYGIWL